MRRSNSGWRYARQVARTATGEFIGMSRVQPSIKSLPARSYRRGHRLREHYLITIAKQL